MRQRPQKVKASPKKKNPIGRPTKYKPKYCQSIIDYFDIKPTDADGNAQDLPFIMDFCISIGISKQCLSEWVQKYPEFGDAYKVAKAKQEQHLVTNTLQNRFNASFAWRAAMNMFKWRDQQDVNVRDVTLEDRLRVLREKG